MAKLNLKRTAITVTIILVSIIVLTIVFISPITKYLIEKYDVKYTGREIKTGMVYVNPFTAFIRINNLKLLELKSDKVFIEANSLSANFSWLKLLSKTYEISEITVDKPIVHVIQKRQFFNFSDLIDRFTPKEKKLVKKARTRLNILDIEINNGEFHYNEQVVPVLYYIRKVNVKSPGMWWNKDTMNVDFSMQSGPSTGDINGNFCVNLSNHNYRLYATVKKFDLKILEQYLHDLANYGSFRASLDAEVSATGNLDDELDLNAKGYVAINYFHFGKTPTQDFASFDKLEVSFREINPKNYKFLFDSLIITRPFFMYEQYDYLDNLQRMFGEGGSKVKAAKADATKFNLIIEIYEYVNKIVKNLLKSYYKVDKIAINEGNLKFNDFALREKFSISANPLYLLVDSIDRHRSRIDATIRTGLLPYGSLGVKLSVNPITYNYFHAQYKLKEVPVSLFNPFVTTYTSFPLDRGTLDFNGTTEISNDKINSNNHLVIIDPRVGKRIRKKDTKWIPVPLIMAFVRERGNVIDYEIPITGDLRNPKIHLKDIIFDLLKNIFVKPPTTPYRLQVSNIERKIEKSLTLKWDIRQSILQKRQEKFLKDIADFLKDNPEASITVIPMQYVEKEKEHLLFFEAKKKYFLLTHNKNAGSFYKDDSIVVDKMFVKDSGFVRYLDKHFNDNMLFTIQEKCMRFVGNNVVNAKYAELIKQRKNSFHQFFKENGTNVRVKILADNNTVPFNGYSFYKIGYKGDFPNSLRKAYDELEELDEKAPREKYKKLRKKNKNVTSLQN